MRAVVQRVRSASVEVDGKVVGAIEGRAEDAQSLQRYERQLCLPLSGMNWLLGPPAVRSVALTGSDTSSNALFANLRELGEMVKCGMSPADALVATTRTAAELLGVLDLDSPVRGRFDEDDRAGLERLGAIWVASLDAHS